MNGGTLVSAATRARVAAAGRWQGAVTRKPLPAAEAGAELAGLAPQKRRRLSESWLGQAATEARVADSFSAVHHSLLALGADGGLVRLAARAVDDEYRHAALAEQMAGCYAGRPVGPHPRLPNQRPEHPDAESDELRNALYVVGQCALNETFASAYLTLARAGATSPLARWALRELLEDEIDHARIGWAFLTELSSRQKRPLESWLLPLTICNVREWRRLELPANESLAAHGVPSGPAVHAAIDDAVAGVLVPGFRHAGLDTRELEGWLRSGAPVQLA